MKYFTTIPAKKVLNSSGKPPFISEADDFMRFDTSQKADPADHGRRFWASPRKAFSKHALVFSMKVLYSFTVMQKRDSREGTRHVRHRFHCNGGGSFG